MPLPKDILEELAAKRRMERETAERDKRRALIICALLCLGWSALGCLLIMWAAHTTSALWGRVAFWAGLGLGYGGIIFTLMETYRRGERRGDW